MSAVNSLPSERVAVVAVVSPGAQTTGAKNSGWFDATGYFRLAAILATGVLGAGGTVDAKWQQADDVNGTNAIDVPNGAITQIVKATGDNKQAVMNLDVNRLTTRNKRFVRLVVTVGGATSDAGATVLGFDARQGPANVGNLSSVAQIASV